MLVLFQQFLLKEAIRSPIYLLNPIIIKQDEINLPRNSIIHYLTNSYDNHFPNRDLIYFNNIPKNKKIPIFHISDLIEKEETTTLLNKTVGLEIRRWTQTNIKEFRSINLIEFPNKDINVHSVYNYNLLKDLYKYKTSLLASYYKYTNLYNTYWHYIKEAIFKDNESYQFITIELPSAIPNYNIINIILKFNAIKYMRVVNDIKLLQILDLFKWLNNDTRGSSTLKHISDEDSKRIVIEFSYKGYSCFLPLYIIRSICKESNLENNIKLSNTKVQKLFILTLYKIQNKVNALLETLKTLDDSIEDNTSETHDKQTNNKLDKEVDTIDNKLDKTIDNIDYDNEDYTNDSNDIDDFSDINSLISKNIDSKKEVRNLNKIDSVIDNELNLNISQLNSLLETEISSFENSDIDKLFEDSILQLESEGKDTEINPIILNSDPEYLDKLLTDKTLQDKFDLYLKEVTEFKLLTAQELRTLKKTFNDRQDLRDPYNKDKKIDSSKILTTEDTNLTKEDVKLNIDNIFIPENLKSNILINMDKKYLNKVLQKDIIACVTNLEKAGLIIKDYTIENQSSALGNYEIHKLNIKPLHGKESIIYFRLPKIDSEGEFQASSIRYRMRKQRTDLPIRKISPTKVAITSNYGKLFIFRTERKSFNNYSYIVDYIKDSYINEINGIKKIKPGNSYSNLLKLPNTYSNLSMNFDMIETDKYTFLFNYNNISNYINEKTLKDLESKKLIFIGYDSSKNILVTNNTDIIFNYSKDMEELGELEDLLEIDRTKIPKPFTMINILGDAIPLGVVLAYYVGLSNLISLTNTKYELLEVGKHFTPTKDQIILKFSDYKLILEPNKEYSLLFAGFLFFKDKLKEYNLENFNTKEIYLSILEFRDFSLLHIKELNLLEELFLDPITVDVLKSINEPIDYLRLLLRANQMLKDFSYPDINDPNFSRIRGYDRVPGLMYRALSESIRAYKFKNNSKSKIELDPYKVWNYVTQDNTIKITEDNNPIVDTKEIEAVTLTGIDGLNKDATPTYLRKFHKNDMGFISEATVDSGDVALNIYLTPYARFKNTRGLIDIDNKNYNENQSKCFSTSAVLTVGSEMDDPKRIGFISIQNGHTIASDGYLQPILRTGYEYLMPYKVGKLYCSIAKEDGIVLDKTDKLITVKYKDNTVETIPLGNKYGRMEGSIYPHNIISDLQIGSKFKQNDYIAYNSNFFEKDWLDPSKLIMKFNRNVTVALTMTNEVFEDSSAISSEFSTKMATTIIKEKSFIIEFNKNIVNILPEGTHVHPNDTLFTILDENTDYNNLSDSTIEMLQSLASLSPKAKVNGIIDKYEIRYNGDIQDMSPSLRKFTSKLDKELYDETKGTEYEVSSGKVDFEYRVDGKNLNPDTLELKVYIRVNLTQAIGDKAVLGGQMKSVTSDVYTNSITTESGEKVDVVFSSRGVLHRIVNSFYLMGTTNRLIKYASKQLIDIYFK